MADLFRMWRNTRMVVLTAICAALYAAILIPFKVIPLIPGITEFRPANAVPIVCSFLFGPAAAWGAAFGNLIGDFFGGLGPGDLFGFLANLLYGLVPYAVWDAVTSRPPVPSDPWPSAVAPGSGAVVGRAVVLWLRLLPFIGLAAMLCATVVGWGLHLLGFHPFTVLGTIVLVNNLVVAVVLAPLLLAVLYPRVRHARLLYRDVLGPRAPLPRWRALLGVSFVVVGTLAAFGAGELVASGRWRPPWVPCHTASGACEVGFGLVPFLGLAIGGLGLL
ncbi:MAG TPA: QueT transporter family protein [Candidatus Binatus sp.]|nr:QueT transporter family protein [Candidatus Binatus sp.]